MRKKLLNYLIHPYVITIANLLNKIPTVPKYKSRGNNVQVHYYITRYTCILELNFTLILEPSLNKISTVPKYKSIKETDSPPTWSDLLRVKIASGGNAKNS